MLRSWRDLSCAIVNTDQCEQRFISAWLLAFTKSLRRYPRSWLRKQTNGFSEAFPLRARPGVFAAKIQEPSRQLVNRIYIILVSNCHVGTKLLMLATM